MRPSERKILSFSTTMRNPERMGQFLSCIKEFDRQVLTNDVIMQVVKNVLKKKIYKPMIIWRDSKLKTIYEDENITFNDEQLEKIIELCPQNHKEKGFEKGWESRFDTWFKLCKEFGFVYYKKDEIIEVSPSGYMLCDAYSIDNENSGEKIQKIFLNALSKYQTDNPFRRNANSNAPIPLLLNVIKTIKEKIGSAGIYRKEIPFLLCWNNNDYVKLSDFIINFRDKFGFKASDEIIYEECLKILESDNRTRFKMSQITKEGVDDFIRKIRITGIFSLRGMGRFIDINKLQLELAYYIMEKYTDYETFTTEYGYYEYMGKLDSVVLKVIATPIENIDQIRINALKEFSKKYTYDDISKELRNLSKGKYSTDDYLRLIEEPTRLEFLTSLALAKKYPSYTVKPNYAIDDEGNPTFTARGGIGDIEVYDKDMDSLVEVTLMKSKQQAVTEIPGITRHLKEMKEKSINNIVFSIFVAPTVHEDTKYMCQFTMDRYKLGIYPYTVDDFVEKLNLSSSLDDLLYKV